MQIIINEKDVKQLKKIKDDRINRYLTKIDNISEDEAIEFMEYLYDKANNYLKGKDYIDTPESILLEKIADYIYDKTK
jgi:hypothetical protein